VNHPGHALSGQAQHGLLVPRRPRDFQDHAVAFAFRGEVSLRSSSIRASLAGDAGRSAAGAAAK